MRTPLTPIAAAMMLLVHSITTAGEPWRADPKQVEKQMSSQHEFNYDEAKVPQFKLPDPLAVGGGPRISNADQWPSMREATMDLFRDHVFGRRPQLDYKTEFQVKQSRENLFGNGATGRELAIKISVGDQSYSFPAYVFFRRSSRARSRPP